MTTEEGAECEQELLGDRLKPRKPHQGRSRPNGHRLTSDYVVVWTLYNQEHQRWREPDEKHAAPGGCVSMSINQSISRSISQSNKQNPSFVRGGNGLSPDSSITRLLAERSQGRRQPKTQGRLVPQHQDILTPSHIAGTLQEDKHHNRQPLV